MLRTGIRSNTPNSHIPSFTGRKLGQSRGWRTFQGICDELPSCCRTKRKCPMQNVNLTVRTRLGEGQVLRARHSKITTSPYSIRKLTFVRFAFYGWLPFNMCFHTRVFLYGNTYIQPSLLRAILSILAKASALATP